MPSKTFLADALNLTYLLPRKIAIYKEMVLQSSCYFLHHIFDSAGIQSRPRSFPLCFQEQMSIPLLFAMSFRTALVSHA